MRVLFINRYSPPDQSGTARILDDLSRDLVKAGMAVSVVSSDGDTQDPEKRYPKRERLDGVDVIRVPTWRFSRGSILGWVLNSFSFYPRALFASLRLRRHDVVVLMSDPPLLQALGPVIRFFTRARLVCWCQDLYPEVAVALGILRERSFPTLILSALSRWSLRRADQVIAIGDGMAGRLYRIGVTRDRIEVIANWADGEAIRPVSFDDYSFVRQHALEGKFVALYSGNLGVGHHFETIIEAARRLRSVDRLAFLFIGAGKRRAWLMERMNESARFLPPQPESMLTQSLGAGDAHLVTLQPGLEGVIVPSKLYSALAAGRPVLFIGPPSSDAARLVEKAGCGFVVAPGDVAGLVHAISTLMRSSALVREMGGNGRRYFEAYCDRRISTGAFARLLTEVDGRPARASRMKRLFDVGFAGLGLILSAPVWAIFALLIRLEDGGPVFFRDRRVGRDGHEFGVLKFRTMVPDADARFGLLQASEDDPRITRVGRWLRATAMDELPQLWNIFRGEMSVVGPRALRPAEVEINAVRREASGVRGGAIPLLDIPGARARLAVRPGLTGLAQVCAPRDLPRRGKFRYDRLYVRRLSVGLDFRLILISIWITLTGSWERRVRPVRFLIGLNRNGRG